MSIGRGRWRWRWRMAQLQQVQEEEREEGRGSMGRLPRFVAAETSSSGVGGVVAIGRRGVGAVGGDGRCFGSNVESRWDKDGKCKRRCSSAVGLFVLPQPQPRSAALITILSLSSESSECNRLLRNCDKMHVYDGFVSMCML